MGSETFKRRLVCNVMVIIAARNNLVLLLKLCNKI